MLKVYHGRAEVTITKSGHESCRWNIFPTVPTENKGRARRENGERVKSYRGERNERPLKARICRER